MFDESGLAFFHRNRIDDAFALDAFQPGFDDFPFGRIEHDRHAGNVRFGGDQLQETIHRRNAVEHGIVHVDVDDLGAVFDLLAGDGQGFVEARFADQAGKGLRAGDVGAFADIDEQ